MGKPRYELPTSSFPYKIPRRLNLLSVPRRYIIDTGEGMPTLTPRGIRKSALRGHVSDRVHDVALPYLRRFIIIKRMYRHRFTQERIEKIDRMIEAANATMYTKLANCGLGPKKPEHAKEKKKKGWSESEWKKHMDYISQIAAPRKEFKPPPIKRGKSRPIEQLIGRLHVLASLPEFKVYKRMSQEDWYRDPIKVRRAALKYQISDRMKKLAEPRKLPEGAE